MKKTAFTLIEILIVVVIIGIIATMTFPRLIRRSPRSEWHHVVEEINNLVYFARQESIVHKEIHRLAFQAPPKDLHSITVQIRQDDPEKPGKSRYIDAKSEYFEARYVLPETITIHAVYQGKKEQLAENKHRAYCHVVPNGLVQDILLLLHRTDTREESKISLKMQPFFGEFEVHHGYLKAEESG